MQRVLVAEDDIFLSSLIMRNLVAEKFDARAAYDGQQATEMLKEWHPDLVLLDLLMPKKDGFDVLQDLRADPSGADVRVIILSNLSEPGTIDRVKPYNIIGYLIKADTTPREVVAKVRSIFV